MLHCAEICVYKERFCITDSVIFDFFFLFVSCVASTAAAIRSRFVPFFRTRAYAAGSTDGRRKETGTVLRVERWRGAAQRLAMIMQLHAVRLERVCCRVISVPAGQCYKPNV